MGLENDPQYEIREIQVRKDIHRTIGAGECSTAKRPAVVVKVKAVYRIQHLLVETIAHFLLLLFVANPFLHFGFPSDSETESRGTGDQAERQLQTHRNKVDRRHRQVHGKVARHASPTGRPREGHNRFGTPVRGSHLDSHQR